jgi:hypothetical protein
MVLVYLKASFNTKCFETGRTGEGSVHSVYILPLTKAFTIPQLMTRAQDIYERQQCAIRLNLEFGLILRHTETGEYRYFQLFSNKTLFQIP